MLLLQIAPRPVQSLLDTFLVVSGFAAVLVVGGFMIYRLWSSAGSDPEVVPQPVSEDKATRNRVQSVNPVRFFYPDFEDRFDLDDAAEIHSCLARPNFSVVDLNSGGKLVVDLHRMANCRVISETTGSGTRDMLELEPSLPWRPHRLEIGNAGDLPETSANALLFEFLTYS
jgi:hypothetical protein